MTVKDGVLKTLEQARGEYVSGERVAKALGVSRQSVCKAVRSLTAEGYEIASSTKRGYSLAPQCDLLSPGVIAAETGARVFYFPAVSSTNSSAAAEYLTGGECLVIALSQTAGRCKDGGEFPSPENGGIYCSFAFPVRIAAEEFESFREECALAAERVIQAASGKEIRRLRLDEFYIGEKKTAGILVEFMLNGAQKRTEFAVVGVGIYTGEAFSSEIAPVSNAESRNRMIVSLYWELQAVKQKFQ